MPLGEGAATGRFILAGSSKEDWTTISDGGVFLAGKGTTRVVLSASGPDSPGIESYSTQVGVTLGSYPATGETQKSSAASLALLGKDQAVLPKSFVAGLAGAARSSYRMVLLQEPS